METVKENTEQTPVLLLCKTDFVILTPANMRHQKAELVQSKVIFSNQVLLVQIPFLYFKDTVFLPLIS